MKDIHEIEKLSLRDLEQIGEDERIPLPEGWQVQLPEGKAAHTDSHRHILLRRAGIAATVAIVAGIGASLLLRPAPPQDTFDDPYLAYAALEQALGRVGETLSAGSQALADTQVQFEKLNYWK